jgi:TrmH family RNA methyltransferase
MHGIITSNSNPRIRNLVLLQSKSRERHSQNRILIEGCREISRAVQSGIRLLEIYYCADLEVESNERTSIFSNPDVQIFEVSRSIFGKLAYREGSDGVIAVAEPQFLSLDSLEPGDTPLLIILESVEKPGNLGAVMRTADAAGVDAVIICDPLTDIYNPNTIRSSVGCIFTTPIVATASEQVMQWLKQRKIKSYAAALTVTAKDVYEFDFRGPTAFVMGTEATGLSKPWLEYCNSQVIIPMNGIADSLNVSVSTAILVYEAYRQRMK